MCPLWGRGNLRANVLGGTSDHPKNPSRTILLRRLPGSHVPLHPEQIGREYWEESQASWGRGFSEGYSKHLRVLGSLPAQKAQDLPAHTLCRGLSWVSANGVQDASPASSLGQSGGDIWTCIQSVGRHMHCHCAPTKGRDPHLGSPARDRFKPAGSGAVTQQDPA